MKQHCNVPVFIPHLGCPFQCIFCNQNKIASSRGIPTRADLINTIDEHLDTIRTSGENIELAFFGGSFTAIDRKLQEEYLSTVQPYLKRGQIGSIRISTRPDCIDDDILEVLFSYGVKTIELGVQSFSDEVLKASGRGYSCGDVFKASHLIKSSGFKLGIQLMIGLPGDRHALDMESTRQAITLAPDMVRIYPTLVIAGTPLELLFKQNKYLPLSLSEAITTCKEMFLQFQQHDIAVIRMGLHPGKELLSPGTIIAGPFHPAFGELVEQEVFKEQACRALAKYSEDKELNPELLLLVHKQDISKMIGHKKNNILYLKSRFQLRSIKVKTCPACDRDTVGLAIEPESEPLFTLTRKEFTELRKGGQA
ncbi:MAG: radical SAM protein [Syntrophomonadaceae bacterium]|nr:radical SAM protein [Syntrophomonadaceae bacterium]MDD3898292.1 radical SAM protein [Syntrophomonadaceae bacterium]MDD4561447.1 radical SAM protein [Syntrophomonadaceae bacterium]